MFNNGLLKFKITSKKLSSGKCQVKFFVEGDKKLYGYALVDSKLTLKEVVDQLDYQIKTRGYKPYYLNNLLKKEQIAESALKNVLIFNS